MPRAHPPAPVAVAPDGDLDLLEGDFYAGDPDPVYKWLRENAPVVRDPVNELWGISRHADIIEIEKNASLWCSSGGYRPNIPADPSMIGQDDPRHLAQRRVLFRRFTPRKVASYEPRIRATVKALIDAVIERGELDVVRDIAIPLPVITILELIGFEPTRWPEFAHWSEVSNSGGAGPRYFTEEVGEVTGKFFATAQQTIEARRREPTGDAISAMLEAAGADGAVPREDSLIALESLLLLNGGSDTTRHVIAGATLALLQHPEQLALLRGDPSRIPLAVEEFIRWVTPILNMCRSATRDTELHGQKISEGDQVVLMYGSANRDETVFDAPHVFDVSRNPNPHLSFGFGTHFCLGASLARLELRVVFEEMLRRLPDLQLPANLTPDFVPNAFTRGLRALPVEF